MKLKPIVRRVLGRAGWQVSQYRAFHELLVSHGVECVLDVGANRGQYVDELRSAGYRGRIVSFEPQGEACELLRRRAANDRDWDVRQLALGPHDGQCELNIYTDDRFSSVHVLSPELDEHLVRTETCEMVQLDSIYDEVTGDAASVFLKLDTQGSELGILDGANRSLERIRGVLVEVSLVPLYDQQPPIEVLLTRLRAAGFVPWSLRPGYRNTRTHQEFEYDAILFRQ